MYRRWLKHRPRTLLTLILGLVGMVVSLTSGFTESACKQELYPFFGWKVYALPPSEGFRYRALCAADAAAACPLVAISFDSLPAPIRAAARRFQHNAAERATLTAPLREALGLKYGCACQLEVRYYYFYPAMADTSTIEIIAIHAL